jgi:hypothetical protein
VPYLTGAVDERIRPQSSRRVSQCNCDHDAVVRDADGVLLWVYPHGSLDEGIDYEVEIEADHGGVRIMVARDQDFVPRAIAVSVGDDPADFADTLVMWGLDSPDDSGEPPGDWFT